MALDDDSSSKNDDVVVPAPSDAKLEAKEPAKPIVATSPEELVVHERAALKAADKGALAQLLAANAFGVGVQFDNLATSGEQTAAMIETMLGGPSEDITSTWSKIVRDRDVAWIVDELEFTWNGKTKRLLTTQLASRDGTAWKIAAWHIAELVPNKRAFELAQAGRLPTPATITPQFDDDHQVHDAIEAAFVSREAYIAAFSDRADATGLGSAPGERMLGGAAVKKAWTNVPATIELVPGVAAGRVGNTVGWGAANVIYSLPNRGSQTFRVFVVLAREKVGWRIVLAQWSNAGPLPQD
jgi:hypothetical protein